MARSAVLLAFFAFLVSLTAQRPAAAASQSFPVFITCNSTGQVCSPAFIATRSVAGASQLTVEYISSPQLCSDLRVSISLDGVPRLTSNFVGPGGSTGPLNLGLVSAGSHAVTVQGEGRIGGCNLGSLASWGGTLIVSDSVPVAVTRILPQLAFGGGWYTALYFTNTNVTLLQATLTFIGNDGLPLTIQALGASSVVLNLPSLGTALFEVQNTGPLTQGYVRATLPQGVTGYAVFRQSVPGVPDQEAVVPLSGNTATTSTLIFDDTKYITGVAVVNVASVSGAVTVAVRDRLGNLFASSTIPLGPNAKTALVLRDIPGLAGVAGTIGTVEFTTSIGNVAALGLRFNGQAFTSIPTTGE